jgi:CheY-like chemotaxis protein
MEQQLLQAQKMEALGYLSAGIIHDFNNILTGILNYANLIKLTNSDDKVENNANQIIRCVEMATNLTKNLLLFTKKHPYETKLVDLNIIVDSIYKIIVKTFPENIRIFKETSKVKLLSNVNVNQIEQVLMNILINAKDAMPLGGQIFIKTEEQAINDPMDNKIKDFAVISITDTGIGIPKDNINKIFDPFFTTKEIGKGTGLGLSIAYNIVNQHKGFINVYSEVNRGTTFRIYLPFYKDIKEIDESFSHHPTAELREINKKILIVEDEQYIIEPLKTLFSEKLGCEVITANNGKEGLNKFLNNKDNIDLIISDMLMPEMDGIDMYYEIIKTEKNIPFIFMTGYDKNIINEDILKNKNVKIINKPISFDLLLKVIYDFFPNS